MSTPLDSTDADLSRTVRLHVFEEAARTGHVPQAAEIAAALMLPEETIRGALKELAEAKVLILAPNDASIWAANPFCAVPSGIRVEANGVKYWAICIWDALGVVAALGADSGVIRSPFGASNELVELHIENGELSSSEAIIHFGVPARHWWNNIGFA